MHKLNAEKKLRAAPTQQTGWAEVVCGKHGFNIRALRVALPAES